MDRPKLEVVENPRLKNPWDILRHLGLLVAAASTPKYLIDARLNAQGITVTGRTIIPRVQPYYATEKFISFRELRDARYPEDVLKAALREVKDKLTFAHDTLTDPEDLIA